MPAQEASINPVVQDSFAKKAVRRAIFCQELLHPAKFGIKKDSRVNVTLAVAFLAGIMQHVLILRTPSYSNRTLT